MSGGEINNFLKMPNVVIFSLKIAHPQTKSPLIPYVHTESMARGILLWKIAE